MSTPSIAKSRNLKTAASKKRSVKASATARRKVTPAATTAINLTGDGNGFDMVTLAAELCDQVPTSNFFQKEGYERNPVASRNNVVAKLLVATNAKMDTEVKLQGAKDLAAVFP